MNFTVSAPCSSPDPSRKSAYSLVIFENCCCFRSALFCSLNFVGVVCSPSAERGCDALLCRWVHGLLPDSPSFSAEGSYPGATRRAVTQEILGSGTMEQVAIAFVPRCGPGKEARTLLSSRAG